MYFFIPNLIFWIVIYGHDPLIYKYIYIMRKIVPTAAFSICRIALHFYCSSYLVYLPPSEILGNGHKLLRPLKLLLLMKFTSIY
jgi:hypothetical protein